MQEIVKIHVRRGVNTNQSHYQWLSTASQAPNVISMSFVPITSLLTGVRGSGFLSHAVNLYLRCEYFRCPAGDENAQWMHMKPTQSGEFYIVLFFLESNIILF